MGSKAVHPLRLVICAVVALAGAALLSLAADGIGVVGNGLSSVWLPALGVVLLLGVVGAAVGAAFPWPARAADEAAGAEPLLPPPSVPAREATPFVLSLHPLEPRAGTSTIAFNLAVKAAVSGVTADCRPRPLCLLREGDLAAALGLDDKAVVAYFAGRPVSADEDILDLAVRHPSGCELLCIGGGAPNGQQLRLLMPVLRRFYDPIVIDCPTDDRWLTEVAVDVSDVVALVGLPTVESASAAARWADRGWERGITGELVELTNRVRAGRRESEGLGSGLQYRASIPEDQLVLSHDRQGLPWILNFESRAGVATADLLQRLLLKLMGREVSSAA